MIPSTSRRPTWARYKGCAYFCDQCPEIKVEDVIGKVKSRILYRLNNMAENNLGAESHVYTQCPSERFPDDIENPKIGLFAFRLAFADGALTDEQKNTAILFGVEKELEKQQLCINTIRSSVTDIHPVK